MSKFLSKILILCLALALVLSSLCFAYADSPLGVPYISYPNRFLADYTRVARFDESSHTFTWTSHTNSEYSSLYELEVQFNTISVENKSINIDFTVVDSNGITQRFSSGNYSGNTFYRANLQDGNKVYITHSSTQDGYCLVLRVPFFYRSQSNEALMSLTIDSLTIDGVSYVDPFNDKAYELTIPKGYALVIDESATGYLPVRYYTNGDTSSKSVQLPICSFYYPFGMILDTETRFTFESEDDPTYIDSISSTLYEQTLYSAYQRILVNPSVTVTSTDSQGNLHSVLNANLTKSLVVGSLANASDIPYSALKLYKISQTHQNYNYVNLLEPPIVAVVRDGSIVWETNISDNNPSVGEIVDNGQVGSFWQNLKDIFTNGSSVLNEFLSSGSNFLRNFASIFSFIPNGFASMFYGALVLVLVIGVIKVFL